MSYFLEEILFSSVSTDLLHKTFSPPPPKIIMHTEKQKKVTHDQERKQSIETDSRMARRLEFSMREVKITDKNAE